MYIHREGKKLIWGLLAVVMVIYLLMVLMVHHWTFFHYLFMTILITFWVMVMLFFRIPRRIFTEDGQRLIAPADGVIVTIEETMEKEYIKEECIQLSIFMNGTDVHVNRYPCDGTVEYYKFHRGNYFVASYPKSSVLNERSSVGLRLKDGQKILIGLYDTFGEIIERAMNISWEEIGLASPGFDLRCMQHEVLYSRLYMS